MGDVKQDKIANFPLRAPLVYDLGIALARCHADFNKSSSDALVLEQFVHDADSAGVRRVLEARTKEALVFAESEGLFTKTREDANIQEFIEEATPKVVDAHLVTAMRGAKLATTVLLHNALDVFFFRLIRFGLVHEREQAFKLVADRKISISALHGRDGEDVADEAIDAWWWSFERESVVKKWEKCVALFGYPVKLSDGVWHFDLDMLTEFDALRHSAVHHDGQTLREFDLEKFAGQMRRAIIIWLTHVGITMGLKAPAEEFFGTKPAT